MKKILVLFLLMGCAHTTQHPDFFIERDVNSLRTYQKITDSKAVVKIYIEGDGYSFDGWGQPTSDPTPHSRFMRDLAFNDPSANVVYLARPCQYIRNPGCGQSNWTTARFSKKNVDSSADAIKKIVGTRDVILIGFSGGAQIAGLVAVLHPEIKVKKLITIAGNLDHPEWTRLKKLPPLKDSLDLNNYKQKYLKIPQIHYVGERDEIVPYRITMQFAGNVVIVPNADHIKGFERIFPSIWE
jgi:pimeloyl-ACP methyl ester carboxylesterase